MIDQGLISNDGVAAQLGVDSIQETGALGYGARLKAQREQAGLSVTDVAATLRLHPNQVRAIEQEDLSRLPALAYVRGFIRSYARVLRLDPAPLLSDLNAKLAPTGKSVVDGMATDIAAAHAAGRERLFPQWAIGIALVIVITLGVIGWQTTLRPATAPSQMAAVPAAASPIPATPAPAPMAPVVVPDTTAPVATSEPASAPAAGIEPVPTPADTAEPTVASSRMASGAPPTVLLRFNGNSWAEVTDRNGKILLSQLNSAGAEHALDGELPLTVVIGDANFASAEVRGAAFNMQPFIRNNVARFTIK